MHIFSYQLYEFDCTLSKQTSMPLQCIDFARGENSYIKKDGSTCQKFEKEPLRGVLRILFSRRGL